MTTADATLDIGFMDAATGAFSRVAALERAVRKPAVLKRVSRVPKLVQALPFVTLVNVFDVRLLFALGIARWKIRRLVLRMNRTEFDGDEGLAELKRIAKRCGDLVQLLDGPYEQRRRLEKLWNLSLLNGVVLHQLENLICEVEDIGETAALSASPEFTASILEQLAAHGIIPSDDL